ncbi:hypothetical protein SBA4_20075 [Candidatus Sulfopaludibacter sp. SbA4]|nr:hypothetical protein SBA4_20075 [Candidatus Sulfopaludibacter sp. SbA4]
MIQRFPLKEQLSGIGFWRGQILEYVRQTWTAQPGIAWFRRRLPSGRSCLPRIMGLGLHA